MAREVAAFPVDPSPDVTPLFIDIETVARPGAEALLPEVQAPANYKHEAMLTGFGPSPSHA